jgi:hypothetical protein
VDKAEGVVVLHLEGLLNLRKDTCRGINGWYQSF